jgi:hypothetical protein
VAQYHIAIISDLKLDKLYGIPKITVILHLLIFIQLPLASTNLAIRNLKEAS